MSNPRFLFLSLLTLAGCYNPSASQDAWITNQQSRFAAGQAAAEQKIVEIDRRKNEEEEKNKRASDDCLAKARQQVPYDYTAFPKCYFPRSLAIMKEYNLPNSDIIELMYNKQYVIAEKLQNHEITKAEAKAENSRVAVEAQNMLTARSDAAATREALQDMQRQPPEIVYVPQSPAPQAPGPIHCTSTTSFGTTDTNCY